MKFEYRKPTKYNTFYLIKNYPELKYYDIISTEKIEDLNDIINLSFELTEDSIKTWKEVNSNDISWKNYGTKAWGVYPGGQSGNPGNINYSSMIKDWSLGKYNKLLFDKFSEKIENQMLFNKKFKK